MLCSHHHESHELLTQNFLNFICLEVPEQSRSLVMHTSYLFDGYGNTDGIDGSFNLNLFLLVPADHHWCHQQLFTAPEHPNTHLFKCWTYPSKSFTSLLLQACCVSPPLDSRSSPSTSLQWGWTERHSGKASKSQPTAQMLDSTYLYQHSPHHCSLPTPTDRLRRDFSEWEHYYVQFWRSLFMWLSGYYHVI